VASIFFFGVGLALYMSLWIGATRRGETESIFARTRSDRREKEILFIVSIGVLALLIALRVAIRPAAGLLIAFVSMSALEALVVWRGSSDEEREHLSNLVNNSSVQASTGSESWRRLALRTGLGIILAIYGLSLLSHLGYQQGAAKYVIVGTAAVAVGLFVLFAPWWIRTVRDLSFERRARIRAQDRADMAAHVHDSVMQTLSLIQRAANNPSEVTRLARMQERDLRIWLANPETFGTSTHPPASLAESALEIEREVENNYGVGVDVVVVGDIKLNETVVAIMAAGREATLNAAKWSGAQNISLYIEAEPDLLSMFVRDQGHGFDLDKVPDDRQGIARSIIERVQRYGGTAVIRSSPESGTEVELRVPLVRAHT
jgi:signal transduction histidine kinase